MANIEDMRRFLSVLLALCALNLSAAGEELHKHKDSGKSQAISIPKTEWLSPFSKVVVEGPVCVHFKRVESDENLKVIYDQRGNTASRFRAVVDKSGVLTVVESAVADGEQPITEATIYYKSIDDISVTRSTVIFEDAVVSSLLDISVKSGATLSIDVDAMDVLVECTGKSLLRMGGAARYFKLGISTATFEGFELQTTAANVDASHDSEVKLSVSERLEAITSTSARLYYRGEPAILRNRNSLFGGEISAVKE